MRRRYAWILTLILIAELAVLCCACGQIACHRCDHGPRCPICDCVRLNRRWALPLMLLLAACMALPAQRRAAMSLCAAMGLPTPLDNRVRLND